MCLCFIYSTSCKCVVILTYLKPHMQDNACTSNTRVDSHVSGFTHIMLACVYQACRTKKKYRNKMGAKGQTAAVPRGHIDQVMF